MGENKLLEVFRWGSEGFRWGVGAENNLNSAGIPRELQRKRNGSSEARRAGQDEGFAEAGPFVIAIAIADAGPKKEKKKNCQKDIL